MNTIQFAQPNFANGALTAYMALKPLVNTTGGNLGGHINALEQAGYLDAKKDFVGKRPRTRLRLTRSGRYAFEKYIAYMRDIVEVANISKEKRI